MFNVLVSIIKVVLYQLLIKLCLMSNDIDHTIPDLQLVRTLPRISKMCSVVTPYEFSQLVSEICPLDLETAGSEQWLEQAAVTQRLR